MRSDFGLVKESNLEAVAIRVECEQDMPEVRVTRTEIEQVLFNLVKNAVEAMGETRTRNPTLNLRVFVEGVFAVIEVSDNGPGMAEDVRRRVFEPFFSTKEVGKGTGLGLSVSFFIVTTNHGGEFSVESHPDLGTRFFIKLPL